jgi:hypothetical protein
MHRPIYGSKTANKAKLSASFKRDAKDIAELDEFTFDYVNYTRQVETPVAVTGRISSYNINTFKGRIYAIDESRPIPFQLSESTRDSASVASVTESLDANARDRLRADGEITFTALPFVSSSGRLKRLLVTHVSKP